MFGCSSVSWHAPKSNKALQSALLVKALCSAQAATGDMAATFEAIIKVSHALLLQVSWSINIV